MSPHFDTDLHTRAPQAHRPWRPVVHDSRQPDQRAARTYCAAVVRELPPRRDLRAGHGTW